jgi:ABC-type transport system substrate-binding protein/ABC-type amino acid transport substrate-binding protein
VEREELLVGVDSAFPPFVDLDKYGEVVGLEVDLFNAVTEAAGIEYRFVSTDWETIFMDLISGRFDAVLSGVTPADAPTELVELTDPYFEIGQVAVVLNANEEIERISDLADAVVGVVPLSWGEFAILGEDAFYPLPAGNIRRFETSSELIPALFDGDVDAIVTHHTVIESYVAVNPGYLRFLPARPGASGSGGPRDTWLTTHSYHIAVPRGADELLDTLNDAIEQIHADSRAAEIIDAWGYTPLFAERPKFDQDPAVASLVAGIERVDDYTVRFVLNRPDPNFDYKMAVPAMAIHSPASLEAHGGGEELAQNPVGTGPYMVEAWEPGQPLTLTANLDYWGELPLIETVVITPVRDAAERYALLKAGQVGLIENLSAEDLDALEENEDKEISVYTRVPVNVAYLGMNRDLAPFDDQNMRLAIATCIDQPDLVETSYPTGTLIASQFVPPNTFGFTPGLLWYERDTERAIALATGAGYTNGMTLTLSLADVPSDYLPEPLVIAEAIQAQLSECNITTTIESLDPDTFTERLMIGQLGLYLSGWSADFPGPIGFLNAHFAGVGNGEQFGAPFPAIVDRLNEAAQTSDRALRTELYSQVNQLLMERVIFVPLAHGGSTLVAHAHLPGVVTNPVRRESLATIGPITDTAPYTRFVYAVGALPLSLDPTDEVDDATFAVTNQIFETLVDFEPATTVLTTGLAIEWGANETADVWQFTLRQGVTFQDGTEFDADAVILNFERLWDPEHPLHIGRTGAFRYFQILFGAFRQPE